MHLSLWPLGGHSSQTLIQLWKTGVSILAAATGLGQDVRGGERASQGTCLSIESEPSLQLAVLAQSHRQATCFHFLFNTSLLSYTSYWSYWSSVLTLSLPTILLPVNSPLVTWPCCWYLCWWLPYRHGIPTGSEYHTCKGSDPLV